jgi:hypothetical protein
MRRPDVETRTTECDRCTSSPSCENGLGMHRDPHHFERTIQFSRTEREAVPSVAGAKNLEDLHSGVNQISSFSFVASLSSVQARCSAAGLVSGAYPRSAVPVEPSIRRTLVESEGSGPTFPTGFPLGDGSESVIRKSVLRLLWFRRAFRTKNERSWVVAKALGGVFRSVVQAAG